MPRLAPLLLLLLLCGAVLALYWQSTLGLLALWTDIGRTTYVHGFLIAALTLWLLVDRRRDLAARRSFPEPRALPLLLLLTLAWLVALRSGIQVAHEAVLPLLLWSATLGLFGTPVARLCAFPMAFLYFAIPFWDVADGSLVALTEHVSAACVRLAGIPASLEPGGLIHVPGGTFEVGDACSGLHFLIVGLATGALFGELHRQGAARRALLLALAAVLSLGANWLRVTGLLVTGQLTAMRADIVQPGPPHYVFGWVVFAVVLVIYVLMADRLLEPLPSDSITAPLPQASAAACVPGETARLLVASAALVLLALGPACAVYDSSLPDAALPTRLLQPAVGGWQGPVSAVPDWQPQFPGADAQALGAYRRGDVRVMAYEAAYASQRHGKKAIGYGTSAAGRGQVVAATQISVVGRLVLQQLLADPEGGQSLLWLWYQVGGRTFASGRRAQLWYGLEAVARIPRSRVVAIRTPCAASCANARAALERFVRDNPWLQAE